MDSAARVALAERVLDLSRAEQTEVVVLDEDQGLTRFTHNAIHQNLAAEDVTLRVRTVVDGRVGVAATNDLDDAALRAVVERASELARFVPQDPDFPGLPAGRGLHPAPAGAYVRATAAAGAAGRAKLAADIFASAERRQAWCAGYVTTSRSGVTVVNSRGARATFDGTESAINVKANATDSTGFAEGLSTDVTTLDAAAIGEVAVEKTARSRNPVAVDPGHWTVILEPPAFGDLMSYMLSHFSAQAYDEGSSFLSDGLDKPYAGENVSLWDDYTHPLAPGMPFDYEGSPTQQLALFENGVARNVVTDSYWAAKLKRENTGHALPAPNSWGPHPRNPVIGAGSKSKAQLIAETERGLLVSRFWYIRPVDNRLTIVTGMTRDGTFLIEKGKITGGVRNLRFNQSILAALKAAEFSSERARSASYSYSIVAPNAKIEGFQFTSGTDF